ncbi:DUF1153 domain-containing protein [Roseobacter sp. HKCC-CH-9208]|uniref:DUF1153 domain-containing protein n=1 Tax=Roseobacter sp. HKCC-CH-9208 TaxID=3120339 RepID=UPI0030EEDC55
MLWAIATGLISRDEALTSWDLSAEELDTWLAKASRYGEATLKATGVQNYPREQGAKSPAAGSAARAIRRAKIELAAVKINNICNLYKY